MQDEFLDALRNPFFLFVSFSALLSFCVVSSSAIGDAVELEFPAYRMAQYELGGIQYGSKNNKVQYEAVSLDGQALRRCVVALWRDVATRDIDDLLSSAVGALLIVVPTDLDLLSPADKALFSDMERRLAATKSSDLAIYVTPTSEKILSVLGDITASTGKSATATQQLLNTVSANTFQFTSTSSASNTPVTQTPSNVIARLEGSDSSASTILFVAHYDSHSLFPSYSVGSDSNGSGVVMLLQLLSILRKFYENPTTRPAYNLVFAWTAAGKLNYQGTRALIETLEKNTAAIIDNDKVELAICIEGVGGPGRLHLHASKQPSEGTAAAQLLKRLKLAAPNESVELVTKKINLNAPQLNWEHERFNIRKLPAVTISRYSSAEDVLRGSMLDTPSQISVDNLERNIRIVAEATLGYILALPETGFSSDPHVSSASSILSRDAVDRHLLSHYIRQFASKSRPVADVQATKAVAANLAATVNSLTKTVTVEPVKLIDAQVYGITTDKLLAEQVKPAIFELFISAFIVLFLTAFYQIVIRAQHTVEGSVGYLRKRV